MSFLQNEAKFSNRYQSRLQDQYGDQIIHLSSNKLPKGLITLESVFDPDDQTRGKGMNLAAKKDDYAPVTIVDGKSLNMGKVCSETEQENFIHLCQEFNDVFSWTYDYLKGFDPSLFQNTIDLVDKAKLVRQKQRPVNPKIEPLMRKELSKLIEANIIFSIKHSSWVANLVPVRKKNGEIRLCVDFRDLNQASLKDHHPLPSMEQILSKVSGSRRFSFLDGFSGYNQVLVKESDRYKTSFTTKWGTYSYCKMPFGLTNAGTTFQKAMEMAFKKLIDKFVLVYLDDIIVYSKNVEDHFNHLRQVFLRCREFGVSLNPAKCVFATSQGKLLGHIVSEDGQTIDPKRTKATLALPLPKHKKGLQSFLGRINFVRRFIPNLATMVKTLTTMLKKDMVFSWTKEGKESFEEIKAAIASAPTLMNPNFEKDFILYTLGGESIIFVVLTQTNGKDEEQPIAFFTEGLKEYEDKYNFVENQVLAVIRALKKFKHLLFHNRIHLLVPHASVKDFLLSKDISEKRAGWITRVMEYDVDI